MWDGSISATYKKLPNSNLKQNVFMTEWHHEQKC